MNSLLIFFGIKSYRDNQLSGSITFLNGLKIGLLITLVASLFYVVGWMIYFHTSESAGQFMEQYTEYILNEMAESGSSPEDIAATKQQYAEFGELYENPLIMAGVTLLEIFPVGLVISLLSSWFLKSKSN